MSNYMQYERFGAHNGEGMRSSVFFSGCSLHCKGCWNPSSWNPRNGEPFTQEVIDKIIKGLDHPAISGLSLLGGEPFENLDGAIPLAVQCRERYGKDKTIWSWSGYTFEQIIDDPNKLELLKLVDVLVEGRFVLAERDTSLQFRGSTNQRVLDVKKSLTNRTPIWLDGIKH